MLKTAQYVNEDAYKIAVNPSPEVSAAIIKNKRRKRMASFFRSLNPANWFDEFSDIKITLEEFGGVKKINQEGKIDPMEYRKYEKTYDQNV